MLVAPFIVHLISVHLWPRPLLIPRLLLLLAFTFLDFLFFVFVYWRLRLLSCHLSFWSLYPSWSIASGLETHPEKPIHQQQQPFPAIQMRPCAGYLISTKTIGALWGVKRRHAPSAWWVHSTGLRWPFIIVTKKKKKREKKMENKRAKFSWGISSSY